MKLDLFDGEEDSDHNGDCFEEISNIFATNCDCFVLFCFRTEPCGEV